jgi:hypothetical protein
MAIAEIYGLKVHRNQSSIQHPLSTCPQYPKKIIYKIYRKFTKICETIIIGRGDQDSTRPLWTNDCGQAWIKVSLSRFGTAYFG